MSKAKTICIAATAVLAVPVSMNSMAMTTSRDNPVEITDKAYMYPSFADGSVLLDKKNGRLPSMGWNSWNAFGSGNTEALTKAMADKIKQLGLDKLGYEYVVLDDGCYKSARVDGKLSNNEKFPSGFKALSEYMHERNLKFGMYNDIGTNLCAGAAVGTCGYEDIDAQTYIDWGVDFLKVDNCYYLWDNATFSNSSNAKYTYAPNIRAITVQGDGIDITLNAVEDGILLGRGAEKNTSGDYVTNIGTFDGTNVGTTPVGEQSGELAFKVNAPSDGEYTVFVNYASGEKAGVGSWLQLAVGDADDETRYYDNILEPGADSDSFRDTPAIKVQLKTGENTVRIMNHRRQENTLYSYAALVDGLNKAKPDNDVVLSICEWGKTQPQNWGYKIGTSWRILNDISFSVGNTSGGFGSAAWSSNNTASITSQYSKAVVMDEYAGLDRGWNDPDMLVIGMNGIDETMSKTHMSMWCMMNSPLMLGLDLRRVEKGDEIYNIIANEDVIALNQDELGVQAKRIYCSLTDKPDTDYVTNTARFDILAKPLANGDVALSFINVNNKADTEQRTVDADTIVSYIGSKMTNADEFKNAESYYIKDLWTKEAYMTAENTFSVSALDACGSVTLRISPILNAESMKEILNDKIYAAKVCLEGKDSMGKQMLEAAGKDFADAITASEAVYNNPAADTEAIQTIYSELVTAEEAFSAVYEQFDEFKKLLDLCDGVKNNADRYERNAAWEEFCLILADAHDIYDAPENTDAVKTASENLNTAKKRLTRVLGDGFNPIAWYVFGEKGLNDISGGGNTAKLVNSGAKLSADGTLSLNANDENNSYMELPGGLLENAESFAFTAWVKVEETRTWARIFDFGTSSTEGYMFLSPYNGGGMTAYAITSSDNKAEQSLTAPPIAAGEWVHIALVQDGENVKLYINGKPEAAAVISNNPKTSVGAAAKYYIGKSQFNDPYFKGELMDVRIYDKSLTADEVGGIMGVYDPDPEPFESVSVHEDFSAQCSFTDDRDLSTRILEASVTNISAKEKTVCAIFAEYDDNGALRNVRTQKEKIDASRKYIFRESAYPDSNTRLFVWDDNMRPIISPFESAPYTEPETTWSVVRKNEDNVSYTAGNSLTIKTERGDLWGTAVGNGTVKNLYLTDIKGDFDVNVTVKYKPEENYQRAALIAYTNDANHVSVMRRYHSSCGGNVFMTTMNENGKAADERNYTADQSAESCMLRLVRNGSKFMGYFSTDGGVSWEEFETKEHSVLGAAETVKIGFYASNGEQDCGSASVIFENFVINGKTVTFNNVE